MKKELMIEKSLVDLAQIFDKNGYKLYIVGGFVRNALMGFCETDTDICSSARVEDVERILAGTQFSCVLINPKLGTLHIYNNEKTVEYEHTTFRAEKYQTGGIHSPDEVEFVDDIRLDASRRDFSINAMYYDICTHEILDFYDGIECVKNRVVKTVETPKVVFSRDGLRILRMARIASELDFDIDNNTFNTAKRMVSQLDAISQERFNKEIVSMIFADNKYQAISNFGMQSRGVEILGQLGAWQYVLTAFYDTLDKEQKRKINNIEWNMLRIAPPALRIPAFVIDMFTGIGLEPTVAQVSLVLGTRGIMLNKKEAVRQALIMESFFDVLYNKLSSQKQIRLFLQKNSSVLNELFGLFKLAKIGDNVIYVYGLMKQDNTPLCIHDLDLNGNDILEEFPEIPPRIIGEILSKLLTICANMPEMNHREILLDIIAQKFA